MMDEMPLGRDQEIAIRDKEINRLKQVLQIQSEALRQLQQELDDRQQQSEEAARRTGRFLSAISHDVRTPASAISMMAEVIHQAGQDPKLVNELPRVTEALKSNAKLLVEMISDVLSLLRFDASTIEVDECEFDLGEMIQAEVEPFQQQAATAGLELRVALPSPSIWVRTDLTKLSRVLRELVDNAIKFTPQGTVDVRCLPSSAGVDLQVQDTGIGIPEDLLDDVFDEFYQINNLERDRNSGTGLSLAICKRLVSGLGYSLDVESTVGKGSTFTVRIPHRI